MSTIERLRNVVDQHGRGMATDLAFALVWVTIVEAFFAFVQGPQWAYYMFMLGGIVAYFGFFATFENGSDDSTED